MPVVLFWLIYLSIYLFLSFGVMVRLKKTYNVKQINVKKDFQDVDGMEWIKLLIL